jgi:hypothetical protein
LEFLKILKFRKFFHFLYFSEIFLFLHFFKILKVLLNFFWLKMISMISISIRTSSVRLVQWNTTQKLNMVGLSNLSLRMGDLVRSHHFNIIWDMFAVLAYVQKNSNIFIFKLFHFLFFLIFKFFILNFLRILWSILCGCATEMCEFYDPCRYAPQK